MHHLLEDLPTLFTHQCFHNTHSFDSFRESSLVVLVKRYYILTLVLQVVIPLNLYS
jgi:hypothetical protein